MIFTMKYHFLDIFEMVKFHVCLQNSQTLGLKNFWSYPFKIHSLGQKLFNLMTNSHVTDEFSE